MTVRRSLPAVREWLRLFRARAAKSATPALRGVAFTFLFKAAGQEDPFEITEAEFFAEDATLGHPQPGVYTVRVLASAEPGAEVLEEQSGDWLGTVEPTFAERAETTDGGASLQRALSASAQHTIHGLHADNARLRVQLQQAEERERKAREEKQALVDAVSQLKTEKHQAELERDEALFQEEQAEAREQAAVEELKALRKRGGELAPVASEAVKTLFDRGLEQLTGQKSIAGEREAIEEAQADLTIALLKNLPNALSLVHAGILPWDALRVAIITAYRVDPGETPPAANWEPPEISDDEEATDEDAAHESEGVH